jgi:Ser/Thr protein kinase RdoA (MazF antagonist)
LKDFLTKPGLRDTVSNLTGAGLTSEERNQLDILAPSLADLCDRASDFELPAALIHPDFCEANFFLHSGSVRIIDWAGTSIGHPFFSLLKLLRENHGKAFASPEHDPVVRAYLEHFCVYETESRLLQALDLVIQLQHAWRLLRWSREVPYYEPDGSATARAQRFMLGVARQLLSAHSVPKTPFEVDR